MDEQRAEFEAWAKQPPTEWDCDRYTENEAWPNHYRHYPAQCAWEGWQAATQRQQERIKELEAQVQALSVDAARYQFLRAGGAYLEPNSEEIYMATDDGGKYYHDRRDFDMDIDTAIAAGKGEVNG